MPRSSLTSFTSTVAHPSPCAQALCFSPSVFVAVCLLILSDVDLMHFVTFLLLHVKRLQLKIDLC